MSKPFKMKNPYPTKRMGKINPNSEGNTDLKDGRSKSSTFQRGIGDYEGSYKQKPAVTKNYKTGYYGA